MPPVPRLRSQPEFISPQFKAAIEAMVWNGSKLHQAAQAVGIATHSLRNALSKPHVKALYLKELEVLRSSERARSVHRLVELRDAANNMVAVQAIRTLERMDDEAERRPAALQHGPGLQIVIVQGTAAVQEACKTVDETPAAQVLLP